MAAPASMPWAKSANEKGVWVVDGAGNTIENIELSGAISSSANGAGIRVEAQNLTLRNVYFHDNQDGLLTSTDLGGSLLIEYSEFAFNGDGSGQTHNMYINEVDRFTLQYSYSHDAIIGHLVKTRALESFILYNRLTGEAGSESYEIDVSNGGPAYVIGNIIEQAANTDNNIFISYGIEGIPADRVSLLDVVNNTLVNDYPSCVLLNIPAGAAPALFQNNLLPDCQIQVMPAAGARFINNVVIPQSVFVDPAAYDYRPLPGSTAVAAGTAPAPDPSGQSLSAVFEYVHPCSAQVRPASKIDVGAYQGDHLPRCLLPACLQR